MILDKKVSYFNNTRDTLVAGTDTIERVLGCIKNGDYKDLVGKVRQGDSDAKKMLPTVAMHGLFKEYRKANSFIEASGIIILDLDDIEDDIEEVKEDIMDSDSHVLAAMVSPSGDGIKLLYLVEPDLINADNYRQIGRQIVTNFEVYGNVDFLSVTDCLIMTYDPNILINEKAIPAFVYIEETIQKDVILEPIDQSKEIWDDAEDFFETVLAEDIAQKTNNNFHFIQVSILDLAKFGFKHPSEDLSFVVNYAESYFKSSVDNEKRFLEVTELSKSYPQTKHPYRFTRSEDDFEEAYVDYSDFMPEDTKPKKKDKTSDSEEVEEIEGDGFINYETFKDKVLKVIAEGDRVGYEISFEDFADAFRFKGTGIITITGIPGHGKTELVDVCTIDLARMYGHQTLIAGFEQTPEEHVIKLIRKIVGTDVTCPSWLNESNSKEFDEAYNFVTDHFKHIDIKSLGGEINAILKALAAKILEQRELGKNPKYVVFDPFNMLSIKGKYSGHEKVEEILRRLTHFSHQMGVMVVLVAHPFKMKKDEKTGQYDVPDFYSVKGSSAFFEMSYHGITVYRKPDGSVLVRILKVKQNNLGRAGADIYFNYDKPSGRYIPINEDGIEGVGDHYGRDWLNKVQLRIAEINNK